MKNKAFFNEVFDQVRDFLDRCMNEHDKIRMPLPDDVEQRIKTLEETLQQMNVLSTELLQKSGIDPATMTDLKEKPPQIDSETWDYVQDLRRSRQRALAYKRRVNNTLKALRERGAGMDGETEGGKKKARKRSFERITGRRNWKPI